jgi:polyhydroxybutyrate depolymerase
MIGIALRRLIWLAAATAALSAFAPGRLHPAASAAGPCARPSGAEYTLHVHSGGLLRNALVHIPRAPAGRRLALVLAFHGSGGNGAEMARYSELSGVSDRNGFIVVYPSSAAHHWTLNDADPSEPHDVAFIARLLRVLNRTICMDPRRVYATGVSNGGGFVARVGCELSSRLAAIAPVAGGYRSLDECRPDRPVSVLEIHGTADPVVPYDGKPPDYAGSVPRFLATWAAIDHCPPSEATQTVARGAERYTWGPCAQGSRVQHLKLAGLGHTWPGGDDSRQSPVSASRAVWDFFRDRVLAQAPG